MLMTYQPAKQACIYRGPMDEPVRRCLPDSLTGQENVMALSHSKSKNIVTFTRRVSAVVAEHVQVQVLGPLVSVLPP